MPYSENNVQGIVTENDMTEKKVILTIKVKKQKKVHWLGQPDLTSRP